MPVNLSGGHGDGEHEEARIEIVPLIDIMFFLLASFMLVSLSMTQMSRVPVSLPSASTSVAENKKPPVHIAVDKSGVITWDAQIVTPSEITERLKPLAANPDISVMIAPDKESRTETLLAVMDAVRTAGIQKMSLETKNPKQ